MSGAQQVTFMNQRSFVTPPAPPSQQAYVTSGTFTFVVPAGVTSVSAVCVGGGASGNGPNVVVPPGQSGPGAGLRYINNLPVTPGETLTILVGAGGAGTTGALNQGNPSQILRASSILVSAEGGPFFNGGTGTALGAGPFGGTVGGGNGGTGRGLQNNAAAGGGGAGGYSGNGGNGGIGGASNVTQSQGGAGNGGGGAGGNGNGQFVSGRAGNGGGVGIFGQGTNGTVSGSFGGAGGAGSSGSGTLYGGGGAGSITSGLSGAGGRGAIRIIWPGNLRQFPSTRTANE